MTEDELITFIGGLDGVEVVVAGPDNGAPEAAWGDVFFSAPGERMPFATIVKRDYPGDESSRLDREGVFRLNLGIGRDALRERFPAGTEHDPAALDRLFPTPFTPGTAGSACSTRSRRPTRCGGSSSRPTLGWRISSRWPPGAGRCTRRGRG